jgi:hypothetical protein
MTTVHAFEPGGVERAAPGAVVWIDERQAIVVGMSDTGRTWTCEITRGWLPRPSYLADVASVIGDRQRVVIIGPSPLRFALKRTYVVMFPRANRQLDVELAPLVVTAQELVGRLRGVAQTRR